MNYNQALAHMYDTRGRLLKTHKWCNNTWLLLNDDKSISVRFHSTDIITFYPEKIVVDCRGWRSITTRQRLWRFMSRSGCRFWSDRKYEGLLVYKIIDGNWEPISTFYDGMEFDQNWNLISKPQELVKKVKSDYDKARANLSGKIRRRIINQLDKIDFKTFDNVGCPYCESRHGVFTTALQRAVNNYDELPEISELEHVKLHMQNKLITYALLRKGAKNYFISISEEEFEGAFTSEGNWWGKQRIIKGLREYYFNLLWQEEQEKLKW